MSFDPRDHGRIEANVTPSRQKAAQADMPEDQEAQRPRSAALACRFVAGQDRNRPISPDVPI